MTLTLWLHALPAPHRVPEPAAIGQEHVQVALHRVFVEGAVQPGPATAHVGGDVVQGAEALQLVLVEDLLHVEPEHRLCTESGQAVAHHQGWAMHWGNGLWAVLRIFFFLVLRILRVTSLIQKRKTPESMPNITMTPNLPSSDDHCP